MDYHNEYFYAYTYPEELTREKPESKYTIIFRRSTKDQETGKLIPRKPSPEELDHAFTVHLYHKSIMYEVEEYLDYHLKAYTGNPKHWIKKTEILLRALIEFNKKPHVIDKDILSWLDKTKQQINTQSPKEDHSTLKPPPVVEDQPLIEIRPEIVPQFYEALKFYFDESEHERLLNILQNVEGQGKVYFMGSSRKLTYAFLELHEGGKIRGTKTNLCQWIYQFFQYQARKDKTPKDFSLSNVKKDLNPNQKPPKDAIDLTFL